MTVPFDAVVIGAGPYGLAVSAALRAAGANVHAIGYPMSFWMRHMPRGMCLRSIWEASHIGDPIGPLTFDAFERERGTPVARPIPIADFIAYGHWFRQRAVPDLDTRTVTRVEARDGHFRVILADGEPIETRRVVVAAGIAPFAARPPAFDGLPRELASHSADHADLAAFAGRRVAVIGGGQSAIESAVLLRENGARVEVIMRAPAIAWVGRAPRDGIVGPLLFDRTDVGPAVISHVVAHPMFVRRLPAAVQRDVNRRALAPGAALWLRPRMNGLAVSAGRSVVRATPAGATLDLRLDDGSARRFDHVLLATGYRVDVRRYRFLAPELVASVRCVEGHPILDEGFESSVRGLHFLGAPAVRSFGAVLRFVSGTEFAAKTLTWRATRRSQMPSAAERGVELQHATQ